MYTPAYSPAGALSSCAYYTQTIPTIRALWLVNVHAQDHLIVRMVSQWQHTNDLPLFNLLLHAQIAHEDFGFATIARTNLASRVFE